MSDELLLFVILCLIYLTDCFVWVGRHSIAFLSWFGDRWVDKASSQIIRTSKGGILVTNPFPPLGKIMCCHLPPISISPDGFSTLNCQTLTHNEVPEKEIVSFLFKEVNDIKVSGRDIFINGRQIIRLWDDQGAERLGEILKSLLDADMTKREGIINELLEGQFDFETAKETLNHVRENMRFLRFVCNSLFLYLFILAPFIVLYFRMTDMLIPIALGMLVISIQIYIAYYLLHKKHCPDARGDRMNNLVKMILCPPVSIRACDLITFNLLANYNPVMIGHLLFSASRFRKFIERTVRNLNYPPIDNFSDKDAKEISIWQNQLILKKTMNYIREVANIEEDLLCQPQTGDYKVHSYCPRCLSQFTQEGGTCPDCQGVDLIALKIPELRSNESGE